MGTVFQNVFSCMYGIRGTWKPCDQSADEGQEYIESDMDCDVDTMDRGDSIIHRTAPEKSRLR